jgi:hypothetical protein
MKTLMLGAAFLLAATSLSMAQDFNPGTVIQNAYGNAGWGCGYSYACPPPGYYHHRRLGPYRSYHGDWR